MRAFGKYMMKKQKNDILTDSYYRILLHLGLPILYAQIVTVFTTVLVNEIYSMGVGQVGFSVMGAVNITLSVGNFIMGPMATGAWIKDSRVFLGKDQEQIHTHCINSIYMLLSMAGCIILVMLLGKEFLFKLIKVPEEIWEEAHTYASIFVGASAFYGTHLYLGCIVNARAGSKSVLLSNLFLPCSLVATAYLYLGIFRLGVKGVALAVVTQYFLQTVLNYILLRKEGILGRFRREQMRIRLPYMKAVCEYGIPLAGQMLLCYIGEVLLSMQTNRYLSVEYIAVIAVTLPISNMLSTIYTVGTAYLPQNYNAGKVERIKEYLRKTMIIGMSYAVVCLIIYASLGRWYFQRLFEDAGAAEMGAEYWFWYGCSMIPGVLIYVFRAFFEATGRGKVALFCATGDLLGKMLCAFWLVPSFGNIGRSLTQLLCWGGNGLFLVLAYLLFRKGIYKECDRFAGPLS